MFIDFRERKRGRKRERSIDMTEKYHLVAFRMHPNMEQICNLGMCPDRELNPQPLGV